PRARGLSHVIVGSPDDRAVRVASTDADVREVGDTALVKLSIVLTSHREDALGRVNLYLPRGARIVAMSYDQGGEPVAATPQPAAAARAAFTDMRRRVLDPALLARRDDGRYRLSVFPVSSHARTTVVVTIAMPRFRRLIVDGARRLAFSESFAAP